MPRVGLKYIVGAPLDETGSLPVHRNGMVIGEAISAVIGVEVNEVFLYANDTISESLKEFKSGKIALNTNDLFYEVQEMLLGHTVNDNELVAKGEDIAPFVGIGFYGRVIRNKKPFYRAVWFWKCQFAEPSDDSKTKGDSLEFTTPTIEGTIFTAKNDLWKTEKIFEDENAAIEWLNQKAGIETTTGGGNDD